jgi:hypothetical protein
MSDIKLTHKRRRHEDQAFINFNSQKEMFNDLKLRRVKINKRIHNLVPGRNSDPDTAKGILGFFERRTITLGELYQHMDTMETLNLLVAQPTIWKKYLNKNREKK